MNRAKAILTVEKLLKKKFKYLCKKEKINIFELHLFFRMASNTHELQSSMKFREKWLDILAFISPTALMVGSDNYWKAIQTVNYVNWYMKGSGRFYVDSYGDLVYSLRINYDFLEGQPDMAIKEIETAIDYYSDLFNSFLDVCLGLKDFDEAKTFIDDLWDEIL
jgi:tetratricopeptide (TPR) repeat protein